MADVGDLRVRLSLDDAQFGRSITSMNRTLQAMGQEIRGLQNRGKDWGNSINGLRTKQEAYSRLLEGQQTRVRRLSEEYERAKQQYGEHSAQAERLAVQLNRASAEMERTERELGELTAELERQERELAITQTGWYRFGEAAQRAGEKLKAIGDGMTKIGKELSMKVTAPLAALGVGAAKAAIDFESAFAGVRKTVNTTEEGFAKLEKGILEMARTLPASASEIAAVAESAGQLGIAEENILSFTKTIIDLGESTNLTAEQGASEFARFANIVGMSQTNFDRLGSSIVGLGNTMATTESEIMSMAMRLAAQGSQVGMTEAQILALSASMSSLGIEAEAGGTAMTTVLKKMQNAVSNGGNDLKAFADAAKVSTTEFATVFKKDAASALDLLIKGLAKSTSEGANLNDILVDMDIKGVREADTMLRMAGASDLFNEAMKTSGKAWEENAALSNEAEQRYATTASQLAMLKNRLVEVGITFGQVLLPYLIQIVETITPVIAKFAEMDVATQKLILVIAGIAAAIGPVLIVMGALISSLGTVMSAFGAVSLAIANAGGAMGALKLAFATVIGPVGLAVAAIVGIGVALTAAYLKIDSFREKVDGVFGSIKNIISNAMDSVVSFFKEKVSVLVDFWNENGTQILEAVSNVFNAIMAVVKFVMPAIQFIVSMVWTAIQQIITGALNVIMGVVKVFTGLFTGDFGKMWEGIKQVFWGAIDLIIGWISLTFVGGLRTLIMNLGKALFKLIKGMWDDIARVFSGSISSVVNYVKNFASNVTSYFINLFTNGVNAFKNLWAISSTYTQTLVNTVKSLISTMKTTVINLITTLKNSFINVFKSLFNGVKSVVISIKDSIVNTIKSINLFQVGKDIIQGLINGIGSMASAVWNKAKSVAKGIGDGIKGVLKINSPSKLTTQFGEWTGEGLAIGMDKTLDMVKKAATGLAEMTSQSIKTEVSLEHINQKSMYDNMANTIARANQPLDLSDLSNLVSQLANRPVEAIIYLDSNKLTSVISKNQYNNASILALTKGV